MTSASIPSATPRTPSRRRKPAPATVLNLYHHEVAASGARGAANRVAAALGISDDTVGRVVARDEAARKAREETPPELQYMPPDAAYEAERAAANAQFVAKLVAKAPQLGHPDVRPIMSTSDRKMWRLPAETPQPVTALHRTPEPVADDPRPAEAPHNEPPPAWPTPTPDGPRPVVDSEPGTYPTQADDLELPPMRDPFDEPLEPLRIPDYPRDPLHPTQPASTDPSDLSGPTIHAPVAPIVVRERVIVRVPVEPPASPIVAWWREHGTPVQLVTAIGVFLLLVAATWLG